MDSFIDEKRVSGITARTEPSKVKLPSPFVVCIIGASSGIGEHIAYCYAKAGASGIVLSSRNTQEIERVAKAVQKMSPTVKTLVVSCDITSAASVAALADKATSEYGRIDVVIPNSGYAGPVTLKVTEGQPEWFQQNFNVNTIGIYHAAHYFIPFLISSENGAKAFIVIGSLAANLINGPIANTGYCLSKMAQSRFIEYLGEQYGDQGLLAVNVHPGAVMTPMAKGNTPEEFLPYLVDDVDLCGAFCVWLSKQAKDLHWLTGRFLSANWDIDGLLAKKSEVVERDLLKWRIAM